MNVVRLDIILALVNGHPSGLTYFYRSLFVFHGCTTQFSAYINTPLPDPHFLLFYILVLHIKTTCKLNKFNS